jgi:hypothetical protein
MDSIATLPTFRFYKLLKINFLRFFKNEIFWLLYELTTIREADLLEAHYWVKTEF